MLTSAIQTIPHLSSGIPTRTVSPATLLPRAPRFIWLPDRAEAKLLVRRYLTDASLTHAVVHGPSLRRLVASVYDLLQRGLTSVPVGHLVLLTSVLAVVTSAWTARDDRLGLFSSHGEADAQAVFWIKTAFDMLECAHRKSDISLECFQGLIVLNTAMLYLEGVSLRSSSTLCRAVSMSRELGLHLLDRPPHGPSSGTGARLTGANAEIGRRVWWHLVATDWYARNPPRLAWTEPNLT